MTAPLDEMAGGLLDALVERIAERAAGLVLERLRAEGRSPVQVDEEQLLDVNAAAAKLAVQTSAIYKLTASGKLPAVKVGGRLRVRLADINQLIIRNLRSDERVNELARAAQAGVAVRSPRTGPRTTRTSARAPASSADGAPPQAATDATLKVLTNDSPDVTPSRRSR